MADQDQELIKVLRDLAATCRDAQEGYEKAAKGVHSDDLRNLFDIRAAERAEFAAELDQLVMRYGGQPGETGHGSAPLRRGWVELEQRIRPREDQEMVKFTTQGEDGGLKHFERALGLDILPPDAREVIERQTEALRRVTGRLSELGV